MLTIHNKSLVRALGVLALFHDFYLEAVATAKNSKEVILSLNISHLHICNYFTSSKLLKL